MDISSSLRFKPLVQGVGQEGFIQLSPVLTFSLGSRLGWIDLVLSSSNIWFTEQVRMDISSSLRFKPLVCGVGQDGQIQFSPVLAFSLGSRLELIYIVLSGSNLWFALRSRLGWIYLVLFGSNLWFREQVRMDRSSSLRFKPLVQGVGQDEYIVLSGSNLWFTEQVRMDGASSLRF